MGVMNQHILAVLNYPGRHACPLHQQHHLLRTSLTGPFLHQAIEFLLVLLPADQSGELGVFGPGGIADNTAKGSPLLIVEDGNDTPAVILSTGCGAKGSNVDTIPLFPLATIGAMGGSVGQAISFAEVGSPVHRIVQNGCLQDGDSGLNLGHNYVLPSTCPLPVTEGSDDGYEEMATVDDVVCIVGAGSYRGTIGEASEMGQAAQGRNQRTIASIILMGSAQTLHRLVHPDKLRL